MQERRRHQRVRFSVPPDILIGCNGVAERGVIENLSLSGLMLRGNLPLAIGRVAGCEFSLCGSPLVDVPVTVVSQVGDVYGVRFQPGLISQVTMDDAVVATLAHGTASVLGVHEVQGRKILRIVGGLNGGLHNDFVHAVTRIGVDEIDVSAVTAIDPAGLQLCLEATGRFQVDIGAQSACFAAAWKKMLQAGAREEFL
jgi:hypothetical protein